MGFVYMGGIYGDFVFPTGLLLSQTRLHRSSSSQAMAGLVAGDAVAEELVLRRLMNAEQCCTCGLLPSHRRNLLRSRVCHPILYHKIVPFQIIYTMI